MLIKKYLSNLLGLIMSLVSVHVFSESNFLVGASKVDITGPIVGASTGYNSPGDELSGLGMRLYSRAFVITHSSAVGGKAGFFAIVVAEQLHLYQSVKMGVVKELSARGYGEIFNEKNIMLSATHTHAAGSNISWYTLFNLFNGVVGFDRLHYQVVVNGITDSIINAYLKQQPAEIKYGEGNVAEGGYNRSSLAYLKNHDIEDYMENIDRRMRLLRFDNLDGKPIGMVNWYGVHTTSLSIDNALTHGDNKGWAAYALEKQMGDDFVAAFAQGANGDVSPNQPDPVDVTLPFLRPSDLDDSLDVIENPVVAGTHQLNAALVIFEHAKPLSQTALNYRHTYINFNDKKLSTPADYSMPWDELLNRSTCTAVVGAGFLAGVEEGGAIDYASEGQVKNNYNLVGSNWVMAKFDLAEVDTELFNILDGIWPLAEHVLQTEKYDACHKEKFALLPVGDVDDFWFVNSDVPFVPTILPLQILQLGEIYIAATPFEMTVMSWRRIEKQLRKELAGAQHIVPAGMSNAYAMYLTTREEYAAQHFEGAFNSFGPWTQDVVSQELGKLAELMNSHVAYDFNSATYLPDELQPRDLSDQQFIETPISSHGVVYDSGNFGEVIQDVKPSYRAEHDKVEVRFQAAHPRTVLQLRQAHEVWDGLALKHYSFFSIETLIDDESGKRVWTLVAKDDDPYTSLTWERDGGPQSLSSKSSATINWVVRNQKPGVFRIRYQGIAKIFSIFGSQYKVFEGVSSRFVLE